ncbi:MAG: efflux RND transporter periplasmic adaptor subunit [Bacteroidales bacterium]|nr:efflux RND transporter periplasmic adaptor subunit [Bacteroidales bacterium]
MDRKIEKKKGIQKKHIPYIIAGTIFLFLISWMVFGDRSSKMRVEKNAVTIAQVEKNPFNDYIRLNGQVQPGSLIQISALESGIIEQKLIDEGSTVKKGDVILKLNNPNLSLSILDSEAQLAEKQNFLRNTQVTMEQEKLNLKQELLSIQLENRRKKRAFEQNSALYNDKLIAKETYLQAKEDYEYSKNKMQLIIDRQKQDSIYRSVQVEQMEESLSNMRLNLSMIRQRIENLNVKAPYDGQLGMLTAEIGQSVSSGEKIGQINVLSDYKIEAKIDEHYIDRVSKGLKGIFERQNAEFVIEISKVYPEVRDGQFKTDFVFVGERPDNIRTGQTYYINLQLGEAKDGIIIPRGSFYQTTGGKWIYVVSNDGTVAQRRDIKIGRQNPQYYEVLEGLSPGENVIVSGYESFGDNQKLILK